MKINNNEMIFVMPDSRVEKTSDPSNTTATAVTISSTFSDLTSDTGYTEQDIFHRVLSQHQQQQYVPSVSLNGAGGGTINDVISSSPTSVLVNASLTDDKLSQRRNVSVYSMTENYSSAKKHKHCPSLSPEDNGTTTNDNTKDDDDAATTAIHSVVGDDARKIANELLELVARTREVRKDINAVRVKHEGNRKCFNQEQSVMSAMTKTTITTSSTMTGTTTTRRDGGRGASVEDNNVDCGGTGTWVDFGTMDDCVNESRSVIFPLPNQNVVSPPATRKDESFLTRNNNNNKNCHNIMECPSDEHHVNFEDCSDSASSEDENEVMDLDNNAADAFEYMAFEESDNEDPEDDDHENSRNASTQLNDEPLVESLSKNHSRSLEITMEEACNNSTEDKNTLKDHMNGNGERKGSVYATATAVEPENDVKQDQVEERESGESHELVDVTTQDCQTRKDKEFIGGQCPSTNRDDTEPSFEVQLETSGECDVNQVEENNDKDKTASLDDACSSSLITNVPSDEERPTIVPPVTIARNDPVVIKGGANDDCHLDIDDDATIIFIPDENTCLAIELALGSSTTTSAAARTTPKDANVVEVIYCDSDDAYDALSRTIKAADNGESTIILTATLFKTDDCDVIPPLSSSSFDKSSFRTKSTKLKLVDFDTLSDLSNPSSFATRPYTQSNGVDKSKILAAAVASAAAANEITTIPTTPKKVCQSDHLSSKRSFSPGSENSNDCSSSTCSSSTHRRMYLRRDRMNRKNRTDYLRAVRWRNRHKQRSEKNIIVVEEEVDEQQQQQQQQQHRQDPRDELQEKEQEPDSIQPIVELSPDCRETRNSSSSSSSLSNDSLSNPITVSDNSSVGDVSIISDQSLD